MPVTDTITATTGPDCGCCNGGCDCPCCTDGYWTQYTFSVAGVIGFTCSDDDCAVLNGDFTLTKVDPTGRWEGRHCTWISGDDVTIDCGISPVTAPAWELTCAGGMWTLISVDTGWSYALSSDPATFCVDGGTFTKTDNGPIYHCTALPDTITLAPAGVFVPCS